MVPRRTAGGAQMDKQAWRTELLARRARLTDAEQDRTALALAAAVLPTVGAGPVAAYASFGTEPRTAPLLAALRHAGAQVLLPVLLPDGDLDWAPYEHDLRAGRRGLLEPPGPRLGRDAVAGCPLVLVPALAVDETGTRLGRGGGSYDRALARATGRVVAALHPGELVAALPAEPHDRPVDAVVLPDRGLVALPARAPHPGARPPAGTGGMGR